MSILRTLLRLVVVAVVVVPALPIFWLGVVAQWAWHALRSGWVAGADYLEAWRRW